jgi:hypothetical protein
MAAAVSTIPIDAGAIIGESRAAAVMVSSGALAVSGRNPQAFIGEQQAALRHGISAAIIW